MYLYAFIKNIAKTRKYIAYNQVILFFLTKIGKFLYLFLLIEFTVTRRLCTIMSRLQNDRIFLFSEYDLDL